MTKPTVDNVALIEATHDGARGAGQGSALNQFPARNLLIQEVAIEEMTMAETAVRTK